MNKIERFQITGMTISGFKSYQGPTELKFGGVTTITGGNGRGKSSVADAIAFAVTGMPFFGERGIDRLHNEENPDVSISLRFLDGEDVQHELLRTRRGNVMSITYDGYSIRQSVLDEMFGGKDVFLSIFNPLYFIEELGAKGKELLEQHLPLIRHETILEQLPELVRESLRNEEINVPDVYLKNRRKEIKDLRETITYLSGQCDLIQTQSAEREKSLALHEDKSAFLQGEISDLEKKQFDGLNVDEMQEQLVEMERRYDEMARDNKRDSAEAIKKIRELHSKISAREAELFTPPNAKRFAECQAKLDSLRVQYERQEQAFGAFNVGSVCPTCHRAIGADELPVVRKALKEAGAAIRKAAVALREEMKKLEEQTQAEAAAFDAAKAKDIRALKEAASRLEKESSPHADVLDQMEKLLQQRQALSAALEFGNLSQAEYDRLVAAREELRSCGAQIAALKNLPQRSDADFTLAIEDAEKQIKDIEIRITNAVAYISKRAELTFSQLKMNRVEIELYELVKSSGELKDTFKFTYSGRRYDRLSLSEKIRAGMELSELMKRLTGRNYPVFVDNMESVDDLENVKPTGQLIFAKCVRNTELQVVPRVPIVEMHQRAA